MIAPSSSSDQPCSRLGRDAREILRVSRYRNCLSDPSKSRLKRTQPRIHFYIAYPPRLQNVVRKPNWSMRGW